MAIQISQGIVKIGSFDNRQHMLVTWATQDPTNALTARSSALIAATVIMINLPAERMPGFC
jgi:hypothetical protein